MNLNSLPLSQEEQKQAVEVYGAEVPDWANSLTLLRVALRHLDDSIPGANLPVTLAAFHQLETATKNLREFFLLRDLDLREPIPGIVMNAVEDAKSE
jgi:hypothetical protein